MTSADDNIQAADAVMDRLLRLDQTRGPDAAPDTAVAEPIDAAGYLARTAGRRKALKTVWALAGALRTDRALPQ